TPDRWPRPHDCDRQQRCARNGSRRNAALRVSSPPPPDRTARSMLRPVLLCALALYACCTSAQVEVLPVEHASQGRILVARVTEQIAPGDYQALLKGITAHPGKYARKLLILDNIGGSA